MRPIRFTAVAIVGSHAPTTSRSSLAGRDTAKFRPAILATGRRRVLLATTVATSAAASSRARRRGDARWPSAPALGASHATLVRQLVAESAAVTGAGTVDGIAIAFVLARILPSVCRPIFPRATTSRSTCRCWWPCLLSALHRGGGDLIPRPALAAYDVTTALVDEQVRVGLGRLAVALADGCARRNDRARSPFLPALVGAVLLTRSFVALLTPIAATTPQCPDPRLDLPQRTDDRRASASPTPSLNACVTSPGVAYAAAGSRPAVHEPWYHAWTSCPSPFDVAAMQIQVPARTCASSARSISQRSASVLRAGC